jgi:small subunit ribosomal protein S1
VELPEQVVSADEDVFVKIIDIDLERRRISLSIKQANEGVDPNGEDFDPALYGMTAEYDDAGNYKYPEGFDPETQEWRDGFDTQREAWEADYAKAHDRWEAHKAFVARQDAAAIEAEAAAPAAAARKRSAKGEDEGAPTSYSSDEASEGGTLASDERLAALREKLNGN